MQPFNVVGIKSNKTDFDDRLNNQRRKRIVDANDDEVKEETKKTKPEENSSGRIETI